MSIPFPQLQQPPVGQAGHPVHTYMEENKAISELTQNLVQELNRLGDDPGNTLCSVTVNHLHNLTRELMEIRTHYVRKDNQLFPILDIQYIALRNKVGKYLGCLEASQDATHVRSLSGQRRLLEWN